MYTVEDSIANEDETSILESLLRRRLQQTQPFTDAFIARVDRIVPFFPLARGDPDDHPLLGESIALAKILIESEQESKHGMDVLQSISTKSKDSMAKLVVRDSVAEAGVRSLQKLVKTKMGHRMKHVLLLKRGGIDRGANVRYSANEESQRIDWRVENSKAE